MKLIQFITIAALFGFSLALQAQDTIYVSKDNKWVKKAKKAERYLVLTHEKNLIKVSDYLLDGTIRSTGTYSAFGEKSNDCKKEGVLTQFYPNGNTKSVRHYKNNQRSGEYRKFYEDGKNKFLCSYVNGKREGKLMMYYPDGTVWRNEVYKNGELQQGYLYDEQGQETVYKPIESMPQFPGGQELMMGYLRANLKYPPKAAKQKQGGRVIVQFVVNKEGRIIQPEILRGVNEELDNAALAVVRKMAHDITWIPGIQDGEAVKVKYTMPVTFKLN